MDDRLGLDETLALVPDIPAAPSSKPQEYPPTRVTTSGRASRLPVRFRDEPPQAPPAVIGNDAATVPVPARSLPRIILIVRDQLKTVLNPFRLFRHYLHRPSRDPDSTVPVSDLCNRQSHFILPDQSAASDDEDLDEYDPPSPFANMSIWRFMRWLNTGGRSKSESEATRLVREVIKADDFNPDDFSDNFNAQAENRWLDRSKDPSGFFDNFKEASVTIDVPSGDKTIAPQPFDVPGLMYRDILSVIKTAFQEPLADKFHFSPFKLYHQLPGSEEVVRGYSELYNSDAFIEEHDKVQRAPLDPQDTGCKLERVVAGIMTWSDGTHLANFGTAKLWPIYMMFGNLS
ncbi:hypothetical protein K435DRAFT_706617, partial [Dendrothele bispora CBS 962.96]